MYAAASSFRIVSLQTLTSLSSRAIPFLPFPFSSLVCSDLIARGIDIPSVSHVISYDVPIDARKYVHRVGRTARAGRSGSAWSLVETQEARHFKELMRSFNHLDKLQKVVLDEKDLDALRPAYEAALGQLKEAIVGRADD